MSQQLEQPKKVLKIDIMSPQGHDEHEISEDDTKGFVGVMKKIKKNLKNGWMLFTKREGDNEMKHDKDLEEKIKNMPEVEDVKQLDPENAQKAEELQKEIEDKQAELQKIIQGEKKVEKVLTAPKVTAG